MPEHNQSRRDFMNMSLDASDIRRISRRHHQNSHVLSYRLK
jgi:hypothetical protein